MAALRWVSAVLLFCITVAPSAAAAMKDEQQEYIRNWSIACQTRGAQGAQLSRNELGYIDTFVFSYLEGWSMGFQALGGSPRDLPSVRAEVCTCAAVRLASRRNLKAPPSGDLLSSTLEACVDRAIGRR